MREVTPAQTERKFAGTVIDATVRWNDGTRRVEVYLEGLQGRPLDTWEPGELQLFVHDLVAMNGEVQGIARQMHRAFVQAKRMTNGATGG